MRKGFSLVELLIVMAIITIIFSVSSMITQVLKLSVMVKEKTDEYSAISQIYNNLSHINNAICIKTTNDKILYQLPLLKDPENGGEWFQIENINGRLLKTGKNTKVQISPEDVIINGSTFDFDVLNKQLRVTLDIGTSRSNLVIYMPNIKR